MSFHAVILAGLLVSLLAQEENTAVSLMERYSLPSAVCADGSPGFFYAALNTSSNGFIFRLMGGGGCAVDEENCQDIRESSTPLFTSGSALFSWPESLAGYKFLSEDDGENPLFSTYNRVFVPYCTQDLHLLDTQSPDGGLQFRGRPYLEEALASVLANNNQNATVVLFGSSSGGVAAFNVARWLLDTFDQVSELSVVLDSSFFFDVEGTLADSLDYITHNPGAAYSTHCYEEFNGGPCCMQFGCMVYRGYYPIADARLRGTFLISPVQDALPAVLDTEQNDALEQDEEDDDFLSALWGVATYTGQAQSLLRNIAGVFPAGISVFAPSCADHNLAVAASGEVWMCLPSYDGPNATDDYDEFSCVFEESGHPSAVTYFGGFDDTGLRFEASISADAWDNVKIDGTSIRGAFEQWWQGRGDASKQVFLFDSCDDMNCNPTCQTGLLPGNRDETDGKLVWAVVTVTFAAAMLILATGTLALVWGLLQGKRAVAIVESRLRLSQKNHGVEDSSPSASGRPRVTSGAAGQDDGAEATPILEWNGLSFWLPPARGRSLSRWKSSSPDQERATPTVPKEKQLLHFMYGAVPDGALCALLGPSGSGKSSLLDLLTGRKDYGRCQGEILFKGKPINHHQDAYINQSGYMRQVNTGYLDGLTVLENLVFAVMIRYPGSLGSQSRRVQLAVEQTSLESSAHTKAGGLSGGQKRRLQLALELLVDRRILFLDEPTSALDANSSLELVTILKRLSKKVTMVVAIHQPRPEVWRLFSHAILLSGGQTVYCGPAEGALAGTARYLEERIRVPMPKVQRPGEPSPKDLAAVPEPTAAAEDNNIYPFSATMTGRPENVAALGTAAGEFNGVVPTKIHGATPGTQGASVSETPASVARDSRKFHAATDLEFYGSFPQDREEPGQLEKDPVQRLREVFRMRQWESKKDGPGNEKHSNLFDSEGVPESRNRRRRSTDSMRHQGARGRPYDGSGDRGGANIASAPAAAVLVNAPRSVPDKLLDRLIMIGNELAGKPQAEECSSPKRRARSRRMNLVRTISARYIFKAVAAIVPEDGYEDSVFWGRESTPSTGTTATISVWKAVAVLLARSWKGGYERELSSTSAALLVAVILICLSVRAASATGQTLMLHLTLSVLSVSMLPVLLVYSPVMIISMFNGWPLTKLEIADGFYSPWCATARYVIDHFAVGVFVSFASVSVTHATFWGDFISELPTSASGVNIQLSCVMTLSAWSMISLFDMLAISGWGLAHVTGLSNAFNTLWAAFSGTVLLVGSIPAVLKAVTFSSPHYWATLCGLRVLLDGLDLTASCEYDSKLYCISSFGDAVVHALDMRVHSTGLSIVVMSALASAGAVALATTLLVKSRHLRAIGSLRQPANEDNLSLRSKGNDSQIVTKSSALVER